MPILLSVYLIQQTFLKRPAEIDRTYNTGQHGKINCHRPCFPGIKKIPKKKKFRSCLSSSDEGVFISGAYYVQLVEKPFLLTEKS